MEAGPEGGRERESRADTPGAKDLEDGGGEDEPECEGAARGWKRSRRSSLGDASGGLWDDRGDALGFEQLPLPGGSGVAGSGVAGSGVELDAPAALEDQMWEADLKGDAPAVASLTTQLAVGDGPASGRTGPPRDMKAEDVWGQTAPLTTQLAQCGSLHELEQLAIHVGAFSPEQVSDNIRADVS